MLKIRALGEQPCVGACFSTVSFVIGDLSRKNITSWITTCHTVTTYGKQLLKRGISIARGTAQRPKPKNRAKNTAGVTHWHLSALPNNHPVDELLVDCMCRPEMLSDLLCYHAVIDWSLPVQGAMWCAPGSFQNQILKETSWYLIAFFFEKLHFPVHYS